jgi:beta-lactamase regulating signal transducer with metallopeptidase domain
MNSIVLALNRWAEPALALAWPMLWQSSLLIGLLFALDFGLRRRLRASVRYALWLMVLVKLASPPSLALPTGLGWWLRPPAPAPSSPRQFTTIVTYGAARSVQPLPSLAPDRAARPPARLSATAWGLAASGAVSLGLLMWMLLRWRQVAAEARRAAPAPDWLEELFAQARRSAGLRRTARLRLIERPMSPAVCGLFAPVILLPRALAEQLSPDQLRAVLLHELFHLRRGDLWLGFAQSLFQTLYWWHPLLWPANARIRRAREEAVDDAVMLTLGARAEAYPPTLLRVARLALSRPAISLGLLGILESRSFLRQRVERLLDFRPPRRAGLTLASVLSVAAFAALALPLGQAPAPAQKPEPAAAEPASAPAVTPALPTPASETQRTSDEVLVQDGKLLYEMGKLDEAEAKLKQARDLDPRNESVGYYLKLVREARLNQALKKADDTGILRATNTPYGVAFSFKGQETQPLCFRTIKLDPDTFEKGMQEFLGLPDGANPAENLRAMYHQFFAEVGVDLSPPKSMFYTHSNGCLLIYATLHDLDVIERAVQVLNAAPRQLTIKALFIKLPKAEVDAFWEKEVEASWEKSGPTNQPPPAGSPKTATLTHSQAAAQLDRWKSKGGANILGEFRVTTLSGRQVEGSVVDTGMTIPGEAQGQPNPDKLTPSLTLDIMPHLTSDSARVEMDLAAKVVEFIGYDDPGPLASGAASNAAPAGASLPLPHFRVRQLAASAGIQDGQTVVLGGFRTQGAAMTNRLPNFGGDVPLVGRLFLDQTNRTANTDVLIFVTPTIIDPAGNPIHQERTR